MMLAKIDRQKKQLSDAIALIDSAITDGVLADTNQGSFYYCSEAAAWEEKAMKFLEGYKAAEQKERT